MRLYDPKVRVFDTWGVWVHEGAPAWRVAVEGWFSSLVDEVCIVRFDDVRITSGDGVAAMSAVVTYTAVGPDGKDLRSLQNRISWVLKTSGHVLRVIHEHTSAPVGFEDHKAIFLRETR